MRFSFSRSLGEKKKPTTERNVAAASKRDPAANTVEYWIMSIEKHENYTFIIAVFWFFEKVIFRVDRDLFTGLLQYIGPLPRRIVIVGSRASAHTHTILQSSDIISYFHYSG